MRNLLARLLARLLACWRERHGVFYRTHEFRDPYHGFFLRQVVVFYLARSRREADLLWEQGWDRWYGERNVAPRSVDGCDGFNQKVK